MGYKFVSNTDTEVILNLFAEFGVDCFEMLDGIFALAVLDKGTGELVLARDGLGLSHFTHTVTMEFSHLRVNLRPSSGCFLIKNLSCRQKTLHGI